MAPPPTGPGTRRGALAVRRFPLLPTWRWLMPLAVMLGALGVAFAGANGPRVYFLVATALVCLLWWVQAWRRPVLIVDDGGYRVRVRGRERLRVRWSEVRSARAVPDEHAMYLDCGDPARNLLLPQHGYGFRFARQPELYALLATRFGDRLERVAKLVPDALRHPLDPHEAPEPGEPHAPGDRRDPEGPRDE